MTAALLAAFALPAFADDATMKNDDQAKVTRLDRTTTASTKQQSEVAPTDARSGMDGGCMHHNTALNMM
jgi:hypothetical protein